MLCVSLLRYMGVTGGGIFAWCTCTKYSYMYSGVELRISV